MNQWYKERVNVHGVRSLCQLGMTSAETRDWFSLFDRKETKTRTYKGRRTNSASCDWSSFDCGSNPNQSTRTHNCEPCSCKFTISDFITLINSEFDIRGYAPWLLDWGWDFGKARLCILIHPEPTQFISQQYILFYHPPTLRSGAVLILINTSRLVDSGSKGLNYKWALLLLIAPRSMIDPLSLGWLHVIRPADKPLEIHYE